MYYSYLFQNTMHIKTTGKITTFVPDENYGPGRNYTEKLDSDLHFTRSKGVLPRLLGVYDLTDNESVSALNKIRGEFKFSRSAMDIYNCPVAGAGVHGDLKISINETSSQKYDFSYNRFKHAQSALDSACPPTSIGQAVARLTPAAIATAAAPLIFRGGVALVSVAAANAMPLAMGAIAGGVAMNYLNNRTGMR